MTTTLELLDKAVQSLMQTWTGEIEASALRALLVHVHDQLESDPSRLAQPGVSERLAMLYGTSFMFESDIITPAERDAFTECQGEIAALYSLFNVTRVDI